ncbi:MAG: FecCD family ABC transporter permease [Bacteroidales bacterium]
MSNKRHPYLYLVIILLMTLGLFVADLLSGSIDIGFQNIMAWVSGHADVQDSWYSAFKLFRLPRVITAVLAGSALSVSGLLMQTLFRNPLAGPYILGISSGASLGVALLVLGAGIAGTSIKTSEWDNLWTVIAGAAGAGMIMLIVSLISMRQKDIMTLLILGVLIGAVVSAIVGLLQYLSQASELKLYVLWTMGSLRGITPGDLRLLIPLITAGLILAWTLSTHLNILLMGEESALTMGTPIRMTRIVIFICVSLLAGSITAFCGPIGFIGIAVPHIVRSIFRCSDHRWLLPASIIVGAGVMLFSDIISNFGPGNAVLPINSITSLVGIPFILWLILSKRKSFFQ